MDPLKDQEVRNLIQKAIDAGYKAGKAKHDELADKVAYLVTDGSGNTVGTMPDLCGFANCFISLKILSRRRKVVKELIQANKLMHWDTKSALCLLIPCVGQEVSANQAGAQAAKQILQDGGIEAWTESRLD